MAYSKARKRKYNDATRQANHKKKMERVIKRRIRLDNLAVKRIAKRQQASI